MSVTRQLYTTPSSAIDAGVIYDQTEAKLQNEVNAALKSQINESFTFGTITSVLATPNTNLNTIVDPGNYRGSTDYTYTNKPDSVSTAFILRVYKSTGASNSNYRHQMYIPADLGNSRIYIRSTPDLGSTWSVWRKIIQDADINSKFPVSIANGGTGATSAANAKANLGLGTAAQNFSAGNYTGTEQLFGISAKCVNTNSALNGKTTSLVIKEHGIFVWNNTDAHSEWDLAIPVTVAQGGTGATTAAAARTNLAVLGTAGGTMTGSINLKGTNVEDGTVVSSETIPARLYFKDKNDTNIGYVCTDFLTDGRQGVVLRTQRYINSTLTSNYLALFIAADGTRTISLSEVVPWRKALNLGTSGALPITVAQGGTGSTSVYVTSTLTTITSDIASAASGFSITAGSYAQWGKVAQVTLSMKTTAATSGGASNGVQFATFKAGHRPATMINGIVSSTGKLATLESNGTAKIWADYAANYTFTFRATYILGN